MKYRIVYDASREPRKHRYFLEIKGWFFWHAYTVGVGCYAGSWKEVVWFSSIADAEQKARDICKHSLEVRSQKARGKTVIVERTCCD